jgi:diaminopimelate decarboxylase
MDAPATKPMLRATGADWIASIDPTEVERIATRFGTPQYFYSADVLRARCAELRGAFPDAQVRYAMKANANSELLGIVRDAGLGIDAVSPWEVRLAREVGFKRRDVIYSPNNPSQRELEAAHRARVLVNLDALSALDRYGTLAAGSDVVLRVNLEIGDGHHPHVITAGPESKFGLSRDELPNALAIARRHALRVIGLHQHIGSGLFDRDVFLSAMDRLLELAREVPDLTLLDVGGGFGIAYRPDEQPIDLSSWGRAVTARFKRFERARGKSVRLLVEPGRFVVAESGVLLTRVTNVKRTRDRVWVGVDSGMHHLVRPAMYGSYHPVRAIRPRGGARAACWIVGPICESGDVLAEDRVMVVPQEGDLLAVEVAGAYGYSMASNYNLRARPAEVLWDSGDARRIRRREKYRDLPT